jgi:drug/metabolite transporter (DMT)-like permease
MKNNSTLKAIMLGLVSTLFMTVGLFINSLLAFRGSHWAWTASLRFLLLIPVLMLILWFKKGLAKTFSVLFKMPLTFMLWGGLGFGGYYALLSFAVRFAPGWLVTAAFMTTVLAGLLLSPLLYRDHRAIIPKKGLLLGSLSVISLFVMQLDRLKQLSDNHSCWIAIGLAIIAAFLWPLGNRKVLLDLEEKSISLDPMQRVLAMAIGSVPVLLALAAFGYHEAGMPDKIQLMSSLTAVVFSGVLGFNLYFKATHMVKSDKNALAAVEGTQASSVLFTLIGEVLFKGSALPDAYGRLGILILISGMAGQMILATRKQRPSFLTGTAPIEGVTLANN